MCFYELLTYSCTAERAHLVELCPIPGHCLPHMVRTKHSTAVCDPCAEAWTLLTMAWERQVAEEKYFEAMMRDLHVAEGRYFAGDTKSCRTEEERSGASVEEIGVVTDERRSVSSAPSSELVYRARRASC